MNQNGKFLLAVGLAWGITSSCGGQEGGKDREKPHHPRRILLIADSPTREYQFLRDLLLRQVESKDAELSIYLQSAVADSYQDVPPEKMLAKFPSSQFSKDKEASLDQFDLIIALDPNWERVGPDSLRHLQDWVGSHGGGLIVVAGRMNSHRLGGSASGPLAPLAAMLPVRLHDYRLDIANHDLRQPCPLQIFDPRSEILALEGSADSIPNAWEKFFWNGPAPPPGKDRLPGRGFFYAPPAEAVHPRALHLANLVVPEEKKDRPFLVAMPFGAGRVVYVGSGELWRLRFLRTAYHERLWLNLAQFAAANAATDKPPTSRLDVPWQAAPGEVVLIEARLHDADGLPLPTSSQPTLRITPPPGSKTLATNISLVPRGNRVSWAGWFQFPGPGEFSLALDAPGAATSPAQPLSVKFGVKELFPMGGDAKTLAARQQKINSNFSNWIQDVLVLTQRLARSGNDPLVGEGKVLHKAIITAAQEDNWGGPVRKVKCHLGKTQSRLLA